MYELKLPDLGEGIHEAEILKWHVAPEDRVAEDAPLVEVETDKAAVVIPSPRAGRIVSTVGGPGDTVVVGQVIVVIDDGSPGRSVDTAPAAAAPAPTDRAPEPAAAAPTSGGPRPPAAPATRRLARELGVDIRRVGGSGPGGRVTPEDVTLASGAPAPAPEPSPSIPPASPGPATERPLARPPAATAGGIPYFELEPAPDFERWGPVRREAIRSVRRKIARRMVTSMTVVPHVVHMDEADVTDLDAVRRRHNARDPDGPRLSLLALVVKAAVAALKRGPMLNSSLDVERGEIVYKHYYNVGLAADTPRGLIVPVIKDADRKSALEVADEIARLAEAARSGEIDLSDLQGGTFTITNIGPLGGTPLAAAINYPEVAILGMGRAADKPVVRDGEVVVRRMLPLTLSFDHRVADGADAARFVSHVVRLLSERDALLLEG